jgi:hypothetical protein
MDTNIAFMKGFILGGTSFNIPLTQQLKPAFWQLGWDVIEQYDYITPNFDTKIMVNIASAFMRHYNTDGNPQHLTPWTDGWVQWDGFVDTMIHLSLSTNRVVDYWSAFGEPDVDFAGTPAQYIEMNRRTDSILTSADPNARLVAPDFINFNPGLMLWGLDTLHQLGVNLAAVSWHEFGSFAPEDVLVHVQQMRDSLAVRPYAANTQIFIPEFGVPDNRLIPGWNAGWVYYFEKADIDWASHSCFDEYDGNVVFDDCFDGALSGMYMADGITPQPNYWFYKAYAELDELTRIDATSQQPRTIALAGKNDVNQEMRIIAGRYQSPLMGSPMGPGSVDIHIKNYPYGNNSTQPVVMQRIPAQTVAYSVPLTSPVTVFSGNLSFTNDSALINIPVFPDGDVFIIYIHPDTGSILATENISTPQEDESLVTVYPNPTSGEVSLLSVNNFLQVQVVDLLGQVIYESAIHQDEMKINLEGYPAGLYFVHLHAPSTHVIKKLVLN